LHLREKKRKQHVKTTNKSPMSDENDATKKKKRTLTITDKSGGRALLFAERAISSLAKGRGRGSVRRPGRSNISPLAFGPSVTSTSAAILCKKKKKKIQKKKKKIQKKKKKKKKVCAPWPLLPS
jgi:hypothetical protein